MDEVSEAKKEYTSYLCNVITPHAIEVFYQMYYEAKDLAKGQQPLNQYQRLLKEVQNWNNNMVKTHCEAITTSCPVFTELVGAVFVSYIKVMSSVRINKSAQKISIKIPSNEVFVHRCFISIARDLYADPYVMQESMTDQLREAKLSSRFSVAIASTVKDLLPIHEILNTYMKLPETDKNIDIGDDMDDEPQSIDDELQGFADLDPEPEPEDEPQPDESVPELEPLASEDIVDEEEDAVKKVEIFGKVPPGTLGEQEPTEPAELDDVLFADAPDKKESQL